MIDDSKLREHASHSRRGGASLTWILFPSIVLTMIIVFIAVQALQIVPNVGPTSFHARMEPYNLAREAGESLPLMLLILGLMMAGVYVALRLGLRPLRRISEQAAGIGPATISQRLPLSATPREIAPLVIAFNQALDRLEAGLRAQRDFSANAAHELRTPLATLRAQVESVLGPADRREATEEFERLGRLITQLLTLAEADSGADLDATGFDLVALARRVTSDMAETIVPGGRDIGFETAHAQWACSGAPALAEVAIRNLLENAVRHTPGGSEILVSLDETGHLRVCDDGPGISPAFRDHLFRRFSKADANSAGAGLGLSIVRRVMLHHGGDVWLESSTTGACFVLDFSACAAAATPSHPAGGW
jgi:signal transduction histidine kinase